MNPVARHGARGEVRVRAAFEAAGVGIEVMRTGGAGDAARIAREHAARFDAVFTLGGDGTAMEVVGALAPDGPPVAILPGGTGNQIARHLRTPLDPAKAVPHLLAGKTMRMDLGRLADGRHFALTAGYGLDVAMIAGASTRWKRRIGVAAYICSGVLALLRNIRVPVRATVDGRSFEATCAMAMIANTGSLMDGFIATGPGVRSDDGLLDLCLYHPRTVLEAIALTLRCIHKDFSPHPGMTFARGSYITLETVSNERAQVDGEVLDLQRLEASVAPWSALLVRGNTD